MTDNEKLEILRRAFTKACQWIHDNPPADLDMYFECPGYLNALVHNAEHPNGNNWQALFISEALEEMKGENNETLV